MGKRTSFVAFLAVIISISLLAFACSKKKDTSQPPPPPAANTSSESENPALPAEADASSESNIPVSQEPPAAGRITEQIEPADIALPGLILAIAYSDKPAVLIGKDLLSEGDSIQGIKVIKINRETVEFEKNGHRWTQQAGETPASYWSDPNS